MKVKSLLAIGTLVVNLGVGSMALAAQPVQQMNQSPVHTVSSDQSVQKHMGQHDKMGWLEDVARLLNMEPSALYEELKSGKSLADVAKEKGMTTDQLKAGMQTALKKRLDEAVKSGRLTQEKANEIVSKSNMHIDQFIQHKGLMRRGHSLVGETAKILNMDPENLRKELQSGKSLADLAKEKGLSQEELKAKLLSAQKERLDSAVKEGHITQEKEQEIINKTNSHIDEWITKKDFGKHEND